MIAAIFDFDGTLVSAPVWQQLIARMLRQRRNVLPVLAHLAYHYPRYPLVKLGLGNPDRLRQEWAEHMPWVLRHVPVKEARDLMQEVAREDLQPTVRPEMLERVDHHRRQGHAVILLSGALQPLLEAFAQLVDIPVALGTQLEVQDGVYTGRLVPPASYGPGKVERLRGYLETSLPQVDLARSFAYADSLSDHPVLSLVGNPVAVAPEDRLRRLAVQSGWSIIE
ncbi:MAG: HAD family hydrolase [Anaerolineae bacterium]|nr:HAD family hydrolase [Anaerolineae bacterium]